ncbi:unnamed protein product, partial [Adineta ricciae]
MFGRFVRNSSNAQKERAESAKPQFCLIRWSDKSGFDIVLERQVQESSDTIEHYKTYQIDFNGKQRKGVVLLRGSKQDCESLLYNVSAPESESSAETEKSSQSKSKSSRERGGANASEILADVQESEEKGNKQDMHEVQNRALMQILQLVLANAVGSTGGNEEVHRVRCDACGTKPIQSDRYKCLNCEDIDLCGPCFERRRESEEHKSGHAFAHFKSPGELFGQTVKNEDVTLLKLKKAYANDIHESISCDGCRAESIKGLRFKCDSCPNYDLCERCAENGVTTKNHDTSHSLILIPRRAIQQIPVEDIELGKELGSGAFGAVYKGRWISKNRPVACKVLTIPRTNDAERLEKSFLKEIAAYSELSGAYILKTYGFAASRQGPNKKYMIVMEYMSR